MKSVKHLFCYTDVMQFAQQLKPAITVKKSNKLKHTKGIQCLHQWRVEFLKGVQGLEWFHRFVAKTHQIEVEVQTYQIFYQDIKSLIIF